MDPVKGAVAGAIGGAAGAYTMELFQAWWNDAEKRLSWFSGWAMAKNSTWWPACACKEARSSM